MLTNIEIFIDFMEQGIAEVAHTSILEATQFEILKKQILALIIKSKHKISSHLISIIFQIYNEKLEANIASLQTLIDSNKKDTSSDFLSFGETYSHAKKITTLMQFNRLHKIVSARVCEIVYYIKHMWSLIHKDFIITAFPKKNIFNGIDIEHAAV